MRLTTQVQGRRARAEARGREILDSPVSAARHCQVRRAGSTRCINTNVLSTSLTRYCFRPISPKPIRAQKARASTLPSCAARSMWLAPAAIARSSTARKSARPSPFLRTFGESMNSPMYHVPSRGKFWITSAAPRSSSSSALRPSTSFCSIEIPGGSARRRRCASSGAGPTPVTRTIYSWHCS